MMYTNIPNANLKNVFNGGHKQYIGIAKFAAFRIDRKDEYNTILDTSSRKIREKLFCSTKKRDVQKTRVFADVFCFIHGLFFPNHENKSTIVILNFMNKLKPKDLHNSSAAF